MIDKNRTHYVIAQFIASHKRNPLTNWNWRAFRAFVNAETKLMLKQPDLEYLADNCHSAADWSDFLLDRGVESHEDDFTAPFFSLKNQPEWLRLAWILKECTTERSPLSRTLRDLTYYIEAIPVSEGMAEQYRQLVEGEITEDEWIDGVGEHATPMKELTEKLMQAKTPMHFLRILKKHHKIMIVTQEENERIPKELNSRLPVGGTWKDRYAIASIKECKTLIELPRKYAPNGAWVGTYCESRLVS